MAASQDKRASEYGGVPRRIQPVPHEPTNSETLMQVYATEPAPLPYVPPVTTRTPPPRQRPEIDPETFTPDTRRMR